VWTVGTGAREATAWNATSSTDVSTPAAFEQATRKLVTFVEHERIVWLEGVHLPQSFTADSTELRTLATRGHAGGGLAAAVSGTAPEETRPVVVHELAHLLTHEAFAQPPPAWIDEGLSEDLAWCRADAKGRLLFGTLDAMTTERRLGGGVVRTTAGPRAAVDVFLEGARTGRAPALSALLSPGTRLFSDAGTRRDAYTAAGLLVRFLLAGDPARAERFRVFLRAATLGAPTGLDDLAAAVDADAKSLEKEYWSFVRRQ
jgi:hypothetical protein